MEYNGFNINEIRFQDRHYSGAPLQQLVKHKDRGIDPQLIHLIAILALSEISDDFTLRIYRNRAEIRLADRVINLTEADPEKCAIIVEKIQNFKYEAPRRPAPKRPSKPQAPISPHILKETGNREKMLQDAIGSASKTPPNPLNALLQEKRASLKLTTPQLYSPPPSIVTNPQKALHKTPNGAKLSSAIASNNPTPAHSPFLKALKKQNKLLRSSKTLPKSSLAIEDAAKENLPKTTSSKGLDETIKRIEAEILHLKNSMKLTPYQMVMASVTKKPPDSFTSMQQNQVRIADLERELKTLRDEKARRLHEPKFIETPPQPSAQAPKRTLRPSQGKRTMALGRRGFTNHSVNPRIARAVSRGLKKIPKR